MLEKFKGLLVHDNSETFTALKDALERLGMTVTQAGSQAQAKRMLCGLNPAPVVFTDTDLPDGKWMDILALSGKAAKHVNVIVVSRLVNTRVYVDAIENGAFDFLAPPFNPTDLAYVVRTALDNAVSRRAARVTAAPGSESQLLAAPATATATSH
jgi:DNA-binding NtrC family response regulator